MLFKSEKCKSRLRRVFHANMMLGSLMFAAAVYLMITGHYDNHLARQSAEMVLNRFALGGLLYLAAFWSADLLGKPYLCPSAEQQA